MVIIFKANKKKKRRGPNLLAKEIRYRPKQYNIGALVLNIDKSRQYFPLIGR